jgi:2-methylcitrate dehydratase
VFEGNKGFKEAIAGDFQLDWAREDLERVTRTIVKKFNAEIHSQSVIEGTLELLQEHPFDPTRVNSILIDIFDVAYHIIGGGEEGDKKTIRTKEEADHSLPYMIAAAILDGQVMPEQYLPERIGSGDIQSLLRKISVKPSEEFSQIFPDEMPCRIAVTLKDGRVLTKEKRDYEGFHTRPMRWETIVRKFEMLSSPYIDSRQQKDIVNMVADIESVQVADLARLLGGLHERAESFRAYRQSI